jgi:hypothetical protein
LELAGSIPHGVQNSECGMQQQCSWFNGFQWISMISSSWQHACSQQQAVFAADEKI